MLISLASLGSSQILRRPHFSTDAASRFCSLRLTMVSAACPKRAPYAHRIIFPFPPERHLFPLRSKIASPFAQRKHQAGCRGGNTTTSCQVSIL